ncbi:MAG: hypothetical protein J1E00_00275 [Oscillospiraceae bacterium]|nr:hypothetical protein [Oscillospiraceae bacterium]
MEELREELRELTDAAAVLLDDRLYTFESYRALVQAVAYAKVMLANEAAEEETLRGAYTGLCEAVDGMELRETEPQASEQAKGKREGLKKKAFPYLLGGAALGGLLLGKKLFGKKKKDEDE